MGDTTLLNLDTIAAGQQQMYQTSNDADNQLERAMNDELSLTVAADTILTADQFVRNFTIAITGNASVYNLTVPQSKRFFSVENDGSAAINVVRGTTSIAVAAGDAALFKTDGTANGLIALVGSTGSLGAAGGDLTGSYPNPTIANTAVTYAKMQNVSANSVLGNATGSPTAVTEVPYGSANGVATLDSGGKVPIAQLPAAVTGALSYQGTWNATTNTPTLASGTGTKGYYYKVATAGSTTLDGISDWNVGDSVVFDGTTWDKINGAEPEVLSVASKTGVVTLVVGDVSGAAPLASPTFTGTPAAPTASPGDNTTKLATTAFVTAAIGSGAPPSGSAGGDLTGSYPNPTIASHAVTYAKVQTVAANSVLGNTTGSSATVAEIPYGSANGVATLDSGGKVPSSQLPSSVTGGLNYQGTWNANTNSPALVSSTGTKGFYYKVSVTGTTALDGISDWNVGDSVVFDGTTWDKINGAEPEVLSVAGRAGAVVLAVADVSGAAPLASPTFTGTPAAPTATAGTNTTQVATTAFVTTAVAAGTSSRVDVYNATYAGAF